MVCLDSVAFTEETLTITSSLRGIVAFDVSAKIAENHMHSGMAGGVAPNPYHILNCALMRVQDFRTQEVKDEFQLSEVPSHRLADLDVLGKTMGHMTEGLPLLPNTQSMAFPISDGDKVKENIRLHLNNFWRSQLAVIGIEGLPSDLSSAGNVLYKEAKFRCSMRIPPRLSAKEVGQKL